MSPNEKSAWFNMAVIMVCLAVFLALYLFLRNSLGVFRALHVASSSFALAALTAFGPLLFQQDRNGKKMLVTQEGTTIRYPYRRLLIIGVSIAFINGAVILLFALARLGNTSIGFASLLPVITVISTTSLIGFVALLYWMKQRTSVITTKNMRSSEVFLFGPELDERDLAIKRIARWSGVGTFWFVFVLGIVGFWGWIRIQGETIVAFNVNVLPMFIFGALLLILMVDSLVTVTLYRRGE